MRSRDIQVSFVCPSADCKTSSLAILQLACARISHLTEKHHYESIHAVCPSSQQCLYTQLCVPLLGLTITTLIPVILHLQASMMRRHCRGWTLRWMKPASAASAWSWCLPTTGPTTEEWTSTTSGPTKPALVCPFHSVQDGEGQFHWQVMRLWSASRALANGLGRVRQNRKPRAWRLNEEGGDGAPTPPNEENNQKKQRTCSDAVSKLRKSCAVHCSESVQACTWR